tara:strand:- start:330 stop:455 length:126 start_codon:yes stop_codon:yes gene_type:complete
MSKKYLARNIATATAQVSQEVRAFLTPLKKALNQLMITSIK